MWNSLLRGSPASGDSWKMDTGTSMFCHNNWCVIKIAHQWTHITLIKTTDSLCGPHYPCVWTVCLTNTLFRAIVFSIKPASVWRTFRTNRKLQVIMMMLIFTLTHDCIDFMILAHLFADYIKNENHWNIGNNHQCKLTISALFLFLLFWLISGEKRMSMWLNLKSKSNFCIIFHIFSM